MCHPTSRHLTTRAGRRVKLKSAEWSEALNAEMFDAAMSNVEMTCEEMKVAKFGRRIKYREVRWRSVKAETFQSTVYQGKPSEVGCSRAEKEIKQHLCKSF